jgi:bifunctional polynucleotide phosphatase/kinase
MEDTILPCASHLHSCHPNYAMFDYDGTLVKPKDGRSFPKDVDDWQYTRPSVPEVVRAYGQTHHIVIVTDQSKPWKLEQIREVVRDLGVECSTVVVGVQTQKPSTALLYQALPLWNAEHAFYVGDAAGRPGDWSDRDKVFAAKAKVRFYTPEEFFPACPRPLATTTASGVVVPSDTKEVVILVGYPASGKSTLARTAFEAANYHITTGDRLKTTAAMIKDAEAHIGTQSVVFDSTAGTTEKRLAFVQFANKHRLPVRALWLDVPIGVAMERNKQRATTGAHMIPDVAFYVYRKKFQAPDESEGYRLETLH